jgi:hypothetical protein
MTRTRRSVRTTATVLLAVLAWFGFGSSSAWAQAADGGLPPPTTITWAGLQWNVNSHLAQKPGPNNWSSGNVSVDASGDLHLAITNVGGTWYCSEIWTNATFLFGTFQWQIRTAVDQLDPNIVLGLFSYGPPADGPDGTHEIDIEYSRFGSTTGDNGRWTVWPNMLTTPPVLGRTYFSLALGTDPTTTSQFTWSPTNVAFSTMNGFQPPGSSTNTLSSWTFQPSDPSAAISTSPQPVDMNFYLYQGNPPTNGLGAEVVIHNFSVTPATNPPAPVPALPRGSVLLLAACLIGVALLGVARTHPRLGPAPRRT